MLSWTVFKEFGSISLVNSFPTLFGLNNDYKLPSLWNRVYSQIRLDAIIGLKLNTSVVYPFHDKYSLYHFQNDCLSVDHDTLLSYNRMALADLNIYTPI